MLKNRRKKSPEKIYGRPFTLFYKSTGVKYTLDQYLVKTFGIQKAIEVYEKENKSCGK